MSLDREALSAAIEAHGRVARLVVAEDEGSAPREAGASMLVWDGGTAGTIGGGRLEFDAIARACRALESGRDWIERIALGPALGQCCGGRVTLLCEIYDAERLEGLPHEGIHARPVPGSEGEMPEAVARLIRSAAAGEALAPRLLKGWMIEPIGSAGRDLWIFGAGHVGRAIVDVMAPLPDFRITWVDTAPERFPPDVAQGVRVLPSVNPADAIALAPREAWHLVLTYSHGLDFEVCHGLLAHGFGWAGLIGSPTKWTRFRKRLVALGHAPEDVERIVCPIGRRAFGKHPQAIAIGVAGRLLEMSAESRRRPAGAKAVRETV